MRLTARRWAERRGRLRAIWRERGVDRRDTYGPWWGDLLFATLDLLGVCDFYEATTNALCSSIRPLHPRERQLLLPYFGEHFPYDLIRLDERAWVGPRWGRFCYVSFHTINSWGPMRDPTLVHEVVHVWQYLRHGAAYAPRALYAQRTPEGYNYGGLQGLATAAELEDFNYEQQADVVEDAFRLVNGYPGQWVPGRGAEVLPLYAPFLREVGRRSAGATVSCIPPEAGCHGGDR